MARIVWDGNSDQELIRESSRRFLYGDVRPVKTQRVPVFPGSMFSMDVEVVPSEFLPEGSEKDRWVLHEPSDPHSRSLNAVEDGE